MLSLWPADRLDIIVTFNPYSNQHSDHLSTSVFAYLWEYKGDSWVLEHSPLVFNSTLTIRFKITSVRNPCANTGKRNSTELHLCLLILCRNISEGGSTACPPCSIQPPCCKMLARPSSLRSALGTMATSLTRPVSHWHQQLNTAVPSLMVRLTMIILSYACLQWLYPRTGSMHSILTLAAIILSTALEEI